MTRDRYPPIRDLAPVGREPESSVHDYVSLNAPRWLVRNVDCARGMATLRVRYRPSVEFAKHPARLKPTDYGVAVEGGPFLQSAVPLSLRSDLAEGTLPIGAGERQSFIVSPRPPRGGIDAHAPFLDGRQQLNALAAHWRVRRYGGRPHAAGRGCPALGYAGALLESATEAVYRRASDREVVSAGLRTPHALAQRAETVGSGE